MLAIFASGILVGAFGYRLYTARTVYTKAEVVESRPKPEDWRKKYIQEARTLLELTDPQIQQLNSILDTTKERFRQMRDRHKSEAEAMKEEQRGNVRAMLTPDQRLKYDEWVRERDKRAQAEQERRKSLKP
jgi:hypothetical protein